MTQEFRTELTALINRHSLENASNTPDHILADYLCRALDAFNLMTQAREHWYGVFNRPGMTKAEIVAALASPRNRENEVPKPGTLAASPVIETVENLVEIGALNLSGNCLGFLHDEFAHGDERGNLPLFKQVKVAELIGRGLSWHVLKKRRGWSESDEKTFSKALDEYGLTIPVRSLKDELEEDKIKVKELPISSKTFTYLLNAFGKGETWPQFDELTIGDLIRRGLSKRMLSRDLGQSLPVHRSLETAFGEKGIQLPD